MALDVPAVQTFINELLGKLARKSIINMLGVLTAVLA
jgi:hypothetical protein